jgi:hypothetical protein
VMEIGRGRGLGRTSLCENANGFPQRLDRRNTDVELVSDTSDHPNVPGECFL